MPAIHVIYDPDSRINTPPPEWFKHARASGAVMQIATPLVGSEEIEEAVAALATLLLQQIAKDSSRYAVPGGLK